MAWISRPVRHPCGRGEFTLSQLLYNTASRFISDQYHTPRSSCTDNHVRTGIDRCLGTLAVNSKSLCQDSETVNPILGFLVATLFFVTSCPAANGHSLIFCGTPADRVPDIRDNSYDLAASGSLCRPVYSKRLWLLPVVRLAVK